MMNDFFNIFSNELKATIEGLTGRAPEVGERNEFDAPTQNGIKPPVDVYKRQLHESQIAVQFHMGRSKMIFRPIIMNNQIMHTVNSRRLKNHRFYFFIHFRIRCGADNGIQRLFHDSVTRVQNKKRHNNPHDSIYMVSAEIFHAYSN